jgi:23S rRNA (uracil1939-C5)-methyltransferase
VRRGELVEARVEKAVYRGLGLLRHEGRVLLVPRAHPGDRVRVRVESVKTGYARGVVEAVLERSPGARPSPCPLFDRCGGCAHQDLAYADQLRIKEAVLRDALDRARVRWSGPVPIVPSPEEGWRTRARLHLQSVQGQWRLGLHREGSHEVLDLEACLQLSPAMNRAQRALLQALADRPQWAAAVSEVDLAESIDGRSLVAALATGWRPEQATALSSLADAVPWLTGLGAWVGPERRRSYLPLRGMPFVEDEVLGLRLRAHVGSFFQVNRFLVGELARAVTEWTPPGGRLLDLYAGVGLFALAAGRQADEVRGLELNPLAVEDARTNARRAGVGHVRIEAGDVAQGLSAWRTSADERVILDPPRTGAGPEVVRLLAQRSPAAVVYVSCDPPTLARDLVAFERAGYRLDALQAFDLFPDTFHVETVARLRPA